MPSNNILRYLIGGIFFLVASYFVYRFSTIVAYILAAWVISLIGQPLTDVLQRLHIGRFRMGPSTAAVLTILAFFLVGIIFLLLFIPAIITQGNNLAHADYRAIAATLEKPYSNFIHWLNHYGLNVAQGSLEDTVQKALKAWIEPNRISAIITQTVMAIGNTLIHIFSTAFIAFFFLQQKNLFTNGLLAMVPPHYEAAAREAVKDTVYLLSRYFRGIFIQVSILTVYISLFLTILGIKNALLIGFFAALMNLVPYLGPFLGGTLGMFITLSSNLGLDFYSQLIPLLAKVLAVFITVQWLDNYFLTPTIFSKSVLAHPLEIFIVILMGATIAGVSGMVLAIPAYTIIRVIARQFFFQFKFVQKMTERMGESGL
ncbi:MAG: AI-2E family transporter [Haliscomenobacter sp.]